MKIELQQRGGFEGRERRVVLDDGAVRVDPGSPDERSFQLDTERWGAMRDLAGRVAVTDQAAPATPALPPSDAMEMKLAIDGAGESRTLHVTSGDNSPPEVWELLGRLQSLLWSELE